ncbi:MAG: class IV adenylate cyclase [bacterium]|nr:class IV adenylate cyclase [bacterium]
MNIEVEIKVKIDSFEGIKEKLFRYGKLKKSIKQIDEYYVPYHRDFFAQKPHPTEWLRIRTNPDKTVFEYDISINKKADGEQECAEEYEAEVSRADEFRKILEFLNFKKVITINKKREYWDCGDFEVALDDVDGLGFFVEVEAKGNFGSNERAKDKCIKFLEKVGVQNGDQKSIKKGYPVLLLDKINSKGT